nr:hypothetical protein [uncultured Mediterranean phage uvMED]
MIDKYIFKFLCFIDSFFVSLEKMFESKPKIKRKKNKCKDCHCKCHCKEILHSHFYDGELCTCETCKC